MSRHPALRLGLPALLAVLLALPPVLARAAERCVLQQDVKLLVGKGKKKRKHAVAAGTELELVRRARKWVRVKAGDVEGVLRTRKFEKVCVAPPPPPAPEPEPAPPAAPAAPTAAAFGETYKIKLLVLDLKGPERVSTDLRTALSSTIAEELDRLGPFKVISSQDVMELLGHQQNQQLLGCDDASCMSEIGGALGADFLVAGSVNLLEDTYVIQLQLIDARAASVTARTSREHSGASKGLLAEVRALPKLLVRDVLGQRDGQLAVAVSEEGATVKVDGSIRGVSPLAPLTLSGGVHTLGVEKEGFVLYQQDVEVAEDRETALSVMLLPSAEYRRQYTERADLIRVLSYVSLGVGVAGFAAFGATYGVAAGETSELNRDIRAYNAQDVRTAAEYERLGQREEDIGTLDVVAITMAVLGAAGVTTGALLWLLGPDPDRYEALGPVDDTAPVQGPDDAPPPAAEPAEEAEAEETPAGETPAEETKAEETKAGETKAGDKPAEETKAEETPVEETKGEKKPAEDQPAGDAPAGSKPPGKQGASLRLLPIVGPGVLGLKLTF